MVWFPESIETSSVWRSLFLSQGSTEEYKFPILRNYRIRRKRTEYPFKKKERRRSKKRKRRIRWGRRKKRERRCKGRKWRGEGRRRKCWKFFIKVDTNHVTPVWSRTNCEELCRDLSRTSYVQFRIVRKRTFGISGKEWDSFPYQILRQIFLRERDLWLLGEKVQEVKKEIITEKSS